MVQLVVPFLASSIGLWLKEYTLDVSSGSFPGIPIMSDETVAKNNLKGEMTREVEILRLK
jgi:hypothetical protein